MHRKFQDKLERAQSGDSPYRVAVTGSAGTGKSMVCRRLERLGVPVIELDTLAKKAVVSTGPALKKIAARFGKKVLHPDGTLNRKALRRIVVRDAAARRDLEKIVHPEVRRLLNRRLNKMRRRETPFVVVEVPLLFEANMEDAFDAVVLVMAEEPVQAKRLSERDRVSEREARLLIRTQIPDEQKVERSDFVVLNSGSVKKLKEAVERVFFALSKKFSVNAEIA